MIQPKMFAVVVIFVGCMLTQIDALTLTNEPFQEGSVVKIKCVMPLYNGQMTWKYNSIEVARCTPDNCLATNSGEGGAFIFAFDISNKIFTWTIVTASFTHDQKLFECIRDNTDKGNFTATVSTKVSSSVSKSLEQLGIAGFALSVAALLFLIFTFLFIGGRCHRSCYRRLNNSLDLDHAERGVVQANPSDTNPTKEHRGNERHPPPNNQAQPRKLPPIGQATK